MESQKINSEMMDISLKMKSAKAEINKKLLLIEDLKKSNLKIIEQNIGKQRNSKSLELQRNRISKMNSEIEELETLLVSLESRFEEKTIELNNGQIKERVSSFVKADLLFTESIKEAKELLIQIDQKIAELYNPLNDLRSIQQSLNGRKLEEIGIDVNKILFKYLNIDLPVFNSRAIENLLLNSSNLAFEIEAMDKGLRAFHKIEKNEKKIENTRMPKHKQTLQNEEQRIEEGKLKVKRFKIPVFKQAEQVRV